ncbi:uncharacterized protein [Elaeis guineensis]|uniref:uncharacterized protein n=1 Tax=Elaeis guineensis var. tenera TaxID=51953 RepID=UPI003C6DB198
MVFLEPSGLASTPPLSHDHILPVSTTTFLSIVTDVGPPFLSPSGFAASLEDWGAECLPTFHTGSGKSVTVRQSSMRKASAVLETEGMNKVSEDGGSDGAFLIFRTGSGKSVMVSQSSIRKAAAVLEEGWFAR